MDEWHAYMPETKPDGFALFWVDDGLMEYAVFGIVQQLPGDEEPRIWDDNDAGYAFERYIAFWKPCNRPTKH